MPRQCLFCPNPANSLEHVWPGWILESLRANQSVRHSIGKNPPFEVDNPAVKVRAVCRQCNNGWMSDLESTNKPLIGSLIHDVSLPLDSTQQSNLAAWMIKVAMLIDFMNRERPQFYRTEERTSLRAHLAIPDGTTIWIGRNPTSNSFHAGGTDVWFDKGAVTKVAHGNVTTVIIGHLAIQSLTIHTLISGYPNGSFNDVKIKGGQWDKLLCLAWPLGSRVNWPPPVSFTSRGALSIAGLMERWRVGKNVA